MTLSMLVVTRVVLIFFFKQKTAYEMRISDWSSDVCSSDLITDAREIKVEEVPDVDQAQAERIFREALEVARQEGRVDDELYSAFGGSQLRQDDAGRAANSGPEQPARNALTQDPADGGVSASGDRGLFDRIVGGIRRLFQQPTAEGPRGQIRARKSTRLSISLFENADRPTFLHETAPFFLEVF